MQFGPYLAASARLVLLDVSDYPLVIYHETKSFDDSIRTLESLEMSNSNMLREHRILNVWNFSMEILARKFCCI